jgi:TRAP-type C4-dicarboxylate transport system permease large subunit
VLIVMLAILILLGCFMESLAMILVVVPFFWPALIALNGGDYATAASAAYGMDTEDLKLWFGILALVVVELGLITPPVGLNVFVIASLAKDVPIIETFRGVLPFFVVEILRIGLLLAVPGLVLLLPSIL